MAEDEIIDFEKMFKFCTIPLRVSLLHPKIRHDKKWFIKISILHGIYFLIFCVVLNSIYLNILARNYDEVFRSILLSIMFYGANLYGIGILVNTDNIVKLITFMQKDFAEDMSEDDYQVVLTYAKKGRRESLIWFIIAVNSIIIIPTNHLFWEIYTYVNNGWELLPLIQLSYPSMIEEIKDHPMVFILTYIFLNYYILCTNVVFAASLSMLPIFMLHACGQVEMLTKRVLTVFVATSMLDGDVKLHDIIRRLQYIYKFVDIIQEFSHYQIVLLMGSVPYCLAISVFQFVAHLTAKYLILMIYIKKQKTESENNIPFESNGDDLRRGTLNVELINFVLGIIYSNWTPCYCSDVLKEKGDELRLAIYSCGWEKSFDRKVRKTLLIMLQRTSRPIVIRTVFRTVCLETFADIMNQAYALFNLVNATMR